MDSSPLSERVSVGREGVQIMSTGMTLDQISTAIATFGPILCVTPDEAYQPCSVEWYVPRCLLLNNDTGQTTPATLDNLPATGNFQLIINSAQGDDTKKGNIATAKAYVNVKSFPGDGYTDVQFWFCYAYNGPGTATISVPLNNGTANLAPMGEHEGDWEHITMRFDNTTLEPTLVYMAQHSGGTWYGIQQIERRGQNIVVYASKNGHATYSVVGPNCSEHREYGPINFDLVNATASGGPELNCSANYAIVGSNYLSITSPSWVAFKGRFGKSSTEQLSPWDVFQIAITAFGPWLLLFPGFVTIAATFIVPYFAKEDQDGPSPPSDKWSWANDGEDSGDLPAVFITSWTTTGLPNCGSGAMDFLVADLDGTGTHEVVQLWNNSGTMGMIVYGWDATNKAMKVTWSTGGLPGCGDGYVKVLVGDINGDGKDEIIQCYDNNGMMGMIVYGGGSTGLSVLWSTGGLPNCGSGFLEMFVANVTGGLAKEIVQFWNSNGSMGAIVYAWVNGELTVQFGPSNLSQGAGYTKMVVGDVNNDGRDEIVQCWNSGGLMGLIVYGGQADGSLATIWSTTGLPNCGAGFVDVLATDINGDGKTEVVQLWDNGGLMGILVYNWTENGAGVLWSTANIGQGSGFTSLLTGDFVFDPSQEIVQAWNDSGKMGLILYEWDATGSLLRAAAATEDTGQGNGFIKMLSGRFSSARSDALQLWDNDGALGMILYSARRISPGSQAVATVRVKVKAVRGNGAGASKNLTE